MSMTITLLQLIQMAAGIGINLYSAYAKFILKSKCDVTADLILLALLMYTSYFILFGDFFYKSYIPKTKNKSQWVILYLNRIKKDLNKILQWENSIVYK